MSHSGNSETGGGLRRMAALRTCRRGVAALEMAMIAPFFIVLLGAMVDLGLLFYEKAQVAQAVSSGLGYAVLAEQAGTAVATISTNVKALVLAEINNGFVSGTNAVISVNNSSPSGDRCCVTFAGGSAVWNCAATPPTCSDGSQPGLYLQVSTSFNYKAVFPEDAFLSTTVSRVAVRRIQ